MATFTKRKAGWQAKVRVKNFPTSSRTFPRKTDAVQWAAKEELRLKAKNEVGVTGGRTFADLWEEFQAQEFVHLSDSDKTSKIKKMEFWLSVLGDLFLEKITTGILTKKRADLEVSRYCRRCHGRFETKAESCPNDGASLKNYAPATINKYMAELSAVFTAAVSWEWMDRNPAQRIKQRPMKNERTRFLSKDEIRRLRASAAESANPWLELIVTLAITTGGRKGEIMGTTWQRVDFDRRRITLVNTKNGETRTVPLVQIAHDALIKHKKVRHLGTDLVFPGKNQDNILDFKTAWATCLRRAGIKDFRFHDCRHTAASYLAMTGCRLIELADMLGHKSLKMVRRYAHLTEDHKADAAERLAKVTLG